MEYFSRFLRCHQDVVPTSILGTCTFLEGDLRTTKYLQLLSWTKMNAEISDMVMVAAYCLHQSSRIGLLKQELTVVRQDIGFAMDNGEENAQKAVTMTGKPLIQTKQLVLLGTSKCSTKKWSQVRKSVKARQKIAAPPPRRVPLVTVLRRTSANQCSTQMSALPSHY